MSKNLKAFNAVLEAAGNGQIEIVREYLKKGKNVNAQGADGRTLLVNACANGHGEIVKLLLESGADAKLTGNTGKSALSYTLSNAYGYAVQGKHGNSPVTEIVKSLTSRGCAVSQGDIISAIWFQSAEVVSHLLIRFPDKKLLSEAAEHARTYSFEYDIDEDQLEINLALVLKASR